MALPTFTPGTQIRAQEMNDALATLFDMVYPVGSIYMSASLSTAEAVNAALPGTWQAWGSGRVPVGVDTSQTEFNSVEKTGGEKTHTLTTSEMPKHSHTIPDAITADQGYHDTWGCDWAYGSKAVTSYNKVGVTPYTGQAGGDGAHNNLQPYITCYMYKRIS